MASYVGPNNRLYVKRRSRVPAYLVATLALVLAIGAGVHLYRSSDLKVVSPAVAEPAR